MCSKNPSGFLELMKYLMILAGQWNFRNQGSIFIKIYEKIKYFLLYCFIISAVMFGVSVIMFWQCKSNVIENFFNCMHLVVVIIVTIMLKSHKTEEIVEFIRHYETSRYPHESIKAKAIYRQICIKNNRIIILFSSIGAYASVSWFFTGRR